MIIYSAAVGGFIASIQLFGSGGPFTYITSGPGNNIETLFDVTSSDGITTGSYVYNTVGTGAWGDYWTSPPQSCLNWELGMEWVWNGENCNTMTFEFGFDEPSLRKLCDPVPTPKPTESPTEEPSVAPTQCDFCDITLEEYLDMCYCDVNDSSDPGIGCGGFDNCVAYFDGCNWCHCTGLGLVCTKKYCPRDQYEEAYCNDCEDGYVLNADHQCIPIGSAQSVNTGNMGMIDEGHHHFVSSEFKKINEIMGYQNNLIYGLIALNFLAIITMVCVCSCGKSCTGKKKR